MGGVVHSVVHAVTQGAKNITHVITHPQEELKNIGHVVTDVAHGHFGAAIHDLGSALDPAHLVGLAHQAVRPITNPINKALAGAIKGVTGHNVLGSHPLNAVGTAAAAVFTGGAAGAIAAGTGFAGAVAGGMASLEGVGASIAGGIGGGLTSIGATSLGGTVSGWGTALSGAAAANSAIAAGTTAAAGAAAGSSSTLGSTWSATQAGSVFNGGVGATGLSSGAAQAGGSLTGNAFNTIASMSPTVGDSAGFGFGSYSAATAGSAGASAGQMGIQAVQTSALGAGATGSAGGFTGLAQAATGQLGTGGVGLYGEGAFGTITNSLAQSGTSSLFQSGVNAAVPGGGFNNAVDRSLSQRLAQQGMKAASQMMNKPQQQAGYQTGGMGGLNEVTGGKLLGPGHALQMGNLLGGGMQMPDLLGGADIESGQMQLGQLPSSTSDIIGQSGNSSVQLTAF